MSEPETTERRGVDRAPALVCRTRTVLRTSVLIARRLAFWLAVVLPVVYVPLLFVDGHWATLAVSALLVAHVLAVLAGSGYDPNG